MPLYLVRHGQTDWNKEKRFQSRTDIPLNSTGLAQAAAVRDELRRRKVEFAAARTTPLGRAQKTAEIILEGTGLSATVEPDFIELEFGGFEGRLEAELRAEFGERFTAWRRSEYTEVPPAGGESIVTGAERVRSALMALKPLAAAGNVLIVAHQAVNMAMKVALSGRTDIPTAATYRQNNDDVDVWDMDRGERIEVFKVAYQD